MEHGSKALPAHMYGNPERIVLAEEGFTCKGCTHRQYAWGLYYCARDEKKAGSKMRRCKHYREG